MKTTTIYPTEIAPFIPKQTIQDVHRKNFFTNLDEDLLRKVRQVKHEGNDNRREAGNYRAE